MCSSSRAKEISPDRRVRHRHIFPRSGYLPEWRTVNVDTTPEDSVASRRIRPEDRVLRGVRRALLWIRSNPSLAFEFLTAGLGIVAFVVSIFAVISQAALVSITIALLALLSVSALLQRVTTLEHVDRRVAAVYEFLHQGALERAVRSGAYLAIESSKSLDAAGIGLAYENLTKVDLTGELGSATRSIRILSNWVGVLAEVGDTLVRKAREGCSVQVLILQHTADYARMRSVELGWPADEVPRQIEGELRRLNALLGHADDDLRSSLQVRAFDSRPPVCMFAYDDVRLIGIFWPRLDAMNGPFIRVSGNGGGKSTTPPLAAIADDQFNRLWAAPSTKYVRLLAGEPEYVVEEDQAWMQGADLEKFVSKLDERDSIKRAAQRGRIVEQLRWDASEVASTAAAGRDAIKLGRMGYFQEVVACLEDAGRLETAEELLVEALRRGYAAPLRRYAILLERDGRLSAAEETLEAFTAGGNWVARSWLVKVLDATGRSTKADANLREWMKAGDMNSRHQLVSRLFGTGHDEEAEELLLEVAEADALAQKRVLEHLKRTGRQDEAERLRDAWQQFKRARRERFAVE
jgi:tetratricopeptide (TPR) repeat protein